MLDEFLSVEAEQEFERRYRRGEFHLAAKAVTEDLYGNLIDACKAGKFDHILNDEDADEGEDK